MHSPETLLSVLSSTNKPLTLQETMYIREQKGLVEREIEKVEGQAKALERRMEALESEVDELRSGIPALETQLQRYDLLLSPSRLMPLEVLGEAFSYLMEDSHTDAFAQTLARLCLVCKQWRDAALIVPRLWSRVSVSVASRGFSYDAISAWLSRSRHIGRTLYLYSYPGCGATRCRGRERCQFSNPDIARLLKKGPTLETLTVATQTAECFENFALALRECEDEAPERPWNALKSIAIMAAGWDRWDDTPESSFLIIPPSVTSLSLQLPPKEVVCTRRLEINIPPLILQNLTSLDIGCDWTVEYTLYILQHCSRLEDLTVRFNQATGELTNLPFMAAALQTRITLPALRRCKMDGLHVDMLINLSHTLMMPLLVELSLSFCPEDDEWCPFRDGPETVFDRSSIPILVSLVCGPTQTTSTLQNLTIANALFRDGMLLEIFRGLPSLTHLTLDSVWFHSGFLAECASPEAYLPKLAAMNLSRRHHFRTLADGPVELNNPASFANKRGLTLTTSRCERCYED